MRKSELRAYTPAIVLLLGSALMLGGTHKQVVVPPAAPLTTILPHVDGYTVRDQKIGDEERRIAGMSEYVARVYLRPDSTAAFTTYVGYYDKQSRGKSIHSPKNCLPGAGWEILQNGTAIVVAADGPHVVNRDVLKLGRQEALVYYWYQGRGRVVASEYTVKYNLLRDAMLTGRTEEALVRLVIPVQPADTNLAQADQIAAQIAPRLLNAVQHVVPRDAAGGGNGPLARAEQRSGINAPSQLATAARTSTQSPARQ